MLISSVISSYLEVPYNCGFLKYNYVVNCIGCLTFMVLTVNDT